MPVQTPSPVARPAGKPPSLAAELRQAYGVVVGGVPRFPRGTKLHITLASQCKVGIDSVSGLHIDSAAVLDLLDLEVHGNPGDGPCGSYSAVQMLGIANLNLEKAAAVLRERVCEHLIVHKERHASFGWGVEGSEKEPFTSGSGDEFAAYVKARVSQEEYFWERRELLAFHELCEDELPAFVLVSPNARGGPKLYVGAGQLPEWVEDGMAVTAADLRRLPSGTGIFVLTLGNITQEGGHLEFATLMKSTAQSRAAARAASAAAAADATAAAAAAAAEAAAADAAAAAAADAAAAASAAADASAAAARAKHLRSSKRKERRRAGREERVAAEEAEELLLT